MTALAIQYREQIIERLRVGKRLSDIAEELNLPITPQALSKPLKSDPEYRAAIEQGFHKRLDDAEKAIEESVDQVDVARARARFTSVAWRAEREFPERWAAKGQVEVSNPDGQVVFAAIRMVVIQPKVGTALPNPDVIEAEVVNP